MRNRPAAVVLAGLLAAAFRPSPASAQTLAPSSGQSLDEPDPSTARVHLGPLGLTPAIDLTNLGVDTNVFYDPPGQEKRDFTFTLTPRTDLILKGGPTWIMGNIREDVVWYQTYSSERSSNTQYTLGWLVPLNRLKLGATASYLTTRERPGFEIDLRVRRHELVFKGAAEVRALSRTSFGVRASRQKVDYAAGSIFLGADLSDELNRVATTEEATIRHQLTPLTAIIVDAGREQDRFEFSPLRDSNSTTAGVQVMFDPAALIKGRARFGFRDFEPLSPGVPAYQGTTAAVDLSYTLLGTTRFGVQLVRDVEYSYDVNQPYYLETGVSGSVAQQIYGPLDVVARGGFENLAYRDRSGAAVLVVDESDKVHSYGGGVGYHVGTDLRIGINIDRQQRLSDVALRRYDGLKAGASVTYGF